LRLSASYFVGGLFIHDREGFLANDRRRLRKPIGTAATLPIGAIENLV
jgi:hypothetical protein